MKIGGANMFQKWTDLSLNKKLLFGFFFMGTILLSIGIINSIIQKQAGDITEEGYKKGVDRIQIIYDLTYEYERMNGFVTMLLIEQELEKREEIFSEIKKSKEKISVLMEKINSNKEKMKITDREWRLFTSFWKTYEIEIESIIQQDNAQFDQIHLQFKYENILRKKINVLEGYIEEWNERSENEMTRTVQNIKEKQEKIIVILSIIIVTVGIGSVIFVFTIMKSITKPINEMVDYSSRMADGDLRGNINNIRKDEIGEMIQSFDKMANSIKDTLQQIVIESENIVNVNKEYHGVISKISSHSSNIIHHFTIAEKEIDIKRNILKENQMSIRDMESNVWRLNKKTQQSLVKINKIELLLNEADIHVQESMDKMTDSSIEIQSTVQSVEKLSEKLKEMMNIVYIVTEISEKTKLLALNTKIHATSEREKNHGFGSIIKRVIELSEMVEGSLLNIKNITQKIDDEIKHLIFISHEIQDETQENVQLFHQMKDKFKDTKKDIQKITNGMKNNVKNIEEIKILTNNLTLSIEDLNDKNDQTSKNILGIAKIIVKQNKTIEETKETSNELVQINQDLNQTKEKFIF